MAEPGIFAYIDGAWVPNRATYPAGINRIFVYKDGAWRGVVTVWSYSKTTKWSQIVDNTWYSAPYLVLHRGAATNTTASMHWDDAPRAVSYRVYKQERGSPASRVMAVPKPPGGTFYQWTGLSELTQYDFWVTGINVFGAESPASNHLHLTTGRNAGPLRHHDPFDWVGKPGPQDSFDMDKKWERWDDGRVVQGHASKPTDQNSFGCVHYATLGQQLQDAFPDTPALINHVSVIKATIVQIRRLNDVGAVRPTLVLHSGYINFGATQTPPQISSMVQNILAPGYPNTGDQGNDIELTHTDWAEDWISTDTQNNGLVIHMAGTTGNDSIGYDGYCQLTPNGSGGRADNWKLKLRISWNYHWPPATEPAWDWS